MTAPDLTPRADAAYRATLARLAEHRPADRAWREALEADAIIAAVQRGDDPFAVLSEVRWGVHVALGATERPVGGLAGPDPFGAAGALRSRLERHLHDRRAKDGAA